jgi:hypothetical protein
MAFTQLNLQTQQLLESTFISDMRIIINANTTLLKNTVQDAFNSIEIDTVNKKIGVDNPLTSIYTTALRLGNELLFTDGSTQIGSLTKSAGKSILEVDRIAIKAGGQITAIGAASKIGVTRLGVGITDIANLSVDGLTIDPSSGLYAQGFAQFSNSIAHSSEAVTSNLVAVSGNPSVYQCDITLNATSKQNIELALVYPITAAAANSLSNPIVVVNIYTNATTPPVKGQAFTFMVKSVKGSDNTDVNSTWQSTAIVRVIGGHDATKNRTIINQQVSAATSPVTIAGPYLKFNGPAANYAGTGTVTVINTTVPMRLVTTGATGLATVAQS